jgi:hypothetical protein
MSPSTRRSTALEGALVSASLCFALACTPSPSPAAPPTPATAPSPAPAPTLSASSPPPPSSSPSPKSSALAPAASPPPLPSPSNSPPTPVLFTDTGAPLPQTEERPAADSAFFLGNLQLLVRAIAADDPSLAVPAFFPVVAYQQVKAIERPERDWKQRLLRAFERNIHEYHRALGADAEHAVFRGIDIPEASVKWMKPGKEGNRVGYYRVLRSKLRVGLREGRERTLELTSLISWRGEWYIVHLSGFD